MRHGKPHSLGSRGKCISLEVPLIMGILNITPDSFSDGGQFEHSEAALAQAGLMLEQGASILDLGAQSSRPGAEMISAEEEWERLKKPLKAIRNCYPEVWISIDTFYSEVARKAAEEGADMINDISCGNLDRQMHETVAAIKIPYVGMHMRGTPSNMQRLADYQDPVKEILEELLPRLLAAKDSGIAELILDPGFGFAKTPAHQWEMLRRLDEFSAPGFPVLIGISRKSFLSKTFNRPFGELMHAYTSVHLHALQKGADILRVHDVREAADALKLFLALQGR